MDLCLLVLTCLQRQKGMNQPHSNTAWTASKLRSLKLDILSSDTKQDAKKRRNVKIIIKLQVNLY